jgi:hypothetical protein
MFQLRLISLCTAAGVCHPGCMHDDMRHGEQPTQSAAPSSRWCFMVVEALLGQVPSGGKPGEMLIGFNRRPAWQMLSAFDHQGDRHYRHEHDNPEDDDFAQSAAPWEEAIRDHFNQDPSHTHSREDDHHHPDDLDGQGHHAVTPEPPAPVIATGGCSSRRLAAPQIGRVDALGVAGVGADGAGDVVLADELLECLLGEAKRVADFLKGRALGAHLEDLLDTLGEQRPAAAVAWWDLLLRLKARKERRFAKAGRSARPSI